MCVVCLSCCKPDLDAEHVKGTSCIFILPSPSSALSCPWLGFVLHFIVFPSFSLCNEKHMDLSHLILDTLQKLPSLEPQHGKEELGVSGTNSTHLGVGVPLLVSHSLWVREEPVEMGSQLAPPVQDLQPGRRNLSSGMQPHPVSTGKSGWPLAPLHCPQHVFPVKNTSPKAQQCQSTKPHTSRPPSQPCQTSSTLFLFLI